jgi:radical SAM protein with 4Fe4S-binding SPASM domain
VLVHGIQGIGTWRIHRAYGVMLALFDGERTVSHIIDIVSPFAKGLCDAGQSERDVASQHVKAFIGFMTKSQNQQKGREDVPSQFPVESLLVLKNTFKEAFAVFPPCFQIGYDPRRYLPSDNNLISSGPFHVVHDSAPRTLNWHLTAACSTKCRYCYLERRTNAVELPVTRVCQLIDEAARIGVFGIDLLGGDILLYPHLCTVLRKLHDHKFLPMMISTKSFLDKDMAISLSEMLEMIFELQFSIDSDDDEVAEYLVGIQSYPQTIFSSIENAISVGFNVTAKSVITPYNLKTIPSLYRELRKRGVKKIRLAVYSRSGFHHTDDLFLAQEDFDWLNNEVDKLNSEFIDDKVTLQNGQPGIERPSPESLKASWSNRSMCTAGRSGMMICVDGRVIPCEQMPETEEYFCGDVSHQSIMDVWNGDRLKEMTYGIPREKFIGQPCYDCAEREECHNEIGRAHV